MKYLIRKINVFQNLIFNFWKEKQLGKKRLAFYGQFISPNDLVYDVGANMGNRINIFLQLGAKIVAVEPQKKCYIFLKRKFGNKINIVTKGAGEKEEKKTFYISNASVLSSFSKDFIESTQNSGRFKKYNWDKTENVEITTLDSIIKEYGLPHFIKIDVEGYELNVLRGLSHSIKHISFEYAVPEQTQKTIDCIKQIASTGKNKILFNYSVGESMEFSLNEWFPIDKMVEHVNSQEFKRTSFGDIYAREYD